MKPITKFNPKNKKTISYGEVLGPAMKITDQDDANQYMKEYIKFIQTRCRSEQNRKMTREEATEIAKHNIGYFAVYYSDEVRYRIYKLFNTNLVLLGAKAI